MNSKTDLTTTGYAIAGAALATFFIFLAPGFFIDHFSSFFETWFNGLSPQQQEIVRVVGKSGFPALGGVMGVIGALVHAERRKAAERED